MRHHRRSVRLRGHNYAQAGAYFITICTQDRACLFGEIVEGKMRLNEVGKIVDEVWRAIPDHFPHVRLDEHVVMPNHVHGVFGLGAVDVNIDAIDANIDAIDVGATHASPLQTRPRGPSRRSVGAVVGAVKSAASKRINEHHGTPAASIWQRNYYEHIIRDESSLNQIRQYIRENPARWAFDRQNSTRVDSNYGEFSANEGHNLDNFDGLDQLEEEIRSLLGEVLG